ncbi:MAG: hypothetical protein R3C60_04585 [Parvularculaceae bacterium]
MTARCTQQQRNRIRCDLSATLFLSEPEDYEGGDLVIAAKGEDRIKLPAGVILYEGVKHPPRRAGDQARGFEVFLDRKRHPRCGAA